MIKPEPQIIKGLAQAVRQHPELLAWMEGVFAHEMKRPPLYDRESGGLSGALPDAGRTY